MEVGGEVFLALRQMGMKQIAPETWALAEDICVMRRDPNDTVSGLLR